MLEFNGGKLNITDTILRDSHQSHAATRMRIEDMLPACELLDSMGYWSVECWGGATFDACMRFLDEDPWERLRTLRKAMPNTKLQMLLRGQNLLGYRHYGDDVVDAFCRKIIENGIDVVRIFDALNDTRNMEASIKSVKKYGGTLDFEKINFNKFLLYDLNSNFSSPEVKLKGGLEFAKNSFQKIASSSNILVYSFCLFFKYFLNSLRKVLSITSVFTPLNNIFFLPLFGL